MHARLWRRGTGGLAVIALLLAGCPRSREEAGRPGSAVAPASASAQASAPSSAPTPDSSTGPAPMAATPPVVEPPAAPEPAQIPSVEAARSSEGCTPPAGSARPIPRPTATPTAADVARYRLLTYVVPQNPGPSVAWIVETATEIVVGVNVPAYCGGAAPPNGTVRVLVPASTKPVNVQTCYSGRCSGPPRP